MNTSGQYSRLLLYILAFMGQLCVAQNSIHEEIFHTTPLPGHNPLLVIILDGFRWDLLDQHAQQTNLTLPGFVKLAKHGAHVKRVSPVFPAECYPNLASMFTGLYPAEHGAIFTQNFDESNGQPLNFDTHENLQDGVLNLLKTNLVQNSRVHMYHLPLCNVSTVTGLECEPYAPEKMTLDALDQTLSDALMELQSGRIKLAIVYHDGLDHVGHEHGPLSDRVIREKLPQLDAMVDRLVAQVQSTDPDKPLNLLITSDHGMNAVKGREDLDRYFLPDKVKMVINRGSTVSIWPEDEHYSEIQRRLRANRAMPRFTVFTNYTIPSEWHTGGPHFPPLLLVAKPGYLIESIHWPIQTGHLSSTPVNGAHGYATVTGEPSDETSCSEMDVPLFLLGPTVKSGSVLEHRHFDHVTTTYALISALSATPDRQPNGNSVEVAHQRQLDPPVIVSSRLLFLITVWVGAVTALLCLVALILGLVLCCQRRCALHTTDTDMEEKLISSLDA